MLLIEYPVSSLSLVVVTYNYSGIKPQMNSMYNLFTMLLSSIIRPIP
ncbi:hypothetical protein [Aeromonas phage Akh-2]|nr:hypothetical protein [Aeromonas phage Akh-2]